MSTRPRLPCWFEPITFVTGRKTSIAFLRLRRPHEPNWPADQAQLLSLTIMPARFLVSWMRSVTSQFTECAASWSFHSHQHALHADINDISNFWFLRPLQNTNLW